MPLPQVSGEHIIRLPPTFTDKLVAALPTWVRGLVDEMHLPEWVQVMGNDKHRQLKAAERQMQRRLIREYRSQVMSMAPMLRARGQV
jgi:hypothetical protein